MKNTPKDSAANDPVIDTSSDKVTPLRCFFAAIFSGVFAYFLYLLFSSIVQTYAVKTVTSTNPIVINLTSAVRTLVMGGVAMATGVFCLVAVGLFLLGIQLTVQGLRKA